MGHLGLPACAPYRPTSSLASNGAGLPVGRWLRPRNGRLLCASDRGSATCCSVGQMSDLREQSWPMWPPVAGDEVANLLGSLERERMLLRWKCAGLDSAGLRARLLPSSMTLGGLLKHLARVEDDYFSVRLLGRAPQPPWDTVDWQWDWHSATDDSPEHLYGLWDDSVRRSRSLMAELLVGGGLDQLGQAEWPGEGRPNLRRHLTDLVEEYARHVGHADFLRESVDGLVGEGPD